MNTATLRRLLNEATPRPWRHWSSDPPYGSRGSTFDAVEDMSSQPIINWSGFDASAFPPRQRRVNAAMIVELVNNADELLAENERLKSLLADWQEFATDVSAADCGGQDWLDGLRGRTKAALEQKP